MIKRTILYGQPEDQKAFDDYYFNKHLVLVRSVPNVLRIEVSKVVDITGSLDLSFYVVAEIWYEDAEAFAAASASPEGAAAAADVPNFATGGVTVLRSEIAP